MVDIVLSSLSNILFLSFQHAAVMDRLIYVTMLMEIVTVGQEV